ncbi:uncharacterized protein LOC141689397 [Apium graveolens]|uniref:uncharacterized protein LOC141689397 n=1 Tax=Apium graveolens TaxID=4045 RepID=UPI003D7B8E1F
MEMKHPSHQHSLILNENYIAKEHDVCKACLEEIISCRLFIYSCSNIGTGSTSSNNYYCDRFLLHKTCAESPHRIEIPDYPNQFLVLSFQPRILPGVSIPCDACSMFMPWTYNYSDPQICICLKCAILLLQVDSLEDCKYVHAAHGHHPLILIQRPTSFKCDICRVKNNFKDMSYKCTKCFFWMHKSCAEAPTTFQFHFHRKHPLILAFSLPEVYQKFTQYCRLCTRTMTRSNWLYYCPKCRFFAHFQCARSCPISSSSEDETYPNLVHLPEVDESSVNLLVQHFVKDLGTLNNKIYNKIFSKTDDIKHWAHDEHRLKLITINELNYQNDDEMLLSCDGCAKPIHQRDCDEFYGCVPCKYYLHKCCAELPEKFEHHLWPGKQLFAQKCNEAYNFFFCSFCGGSGNGIFYTTGSYIQIHIRCMTLPKSLKHEIHPHPLNHINRTRTLCSACGNTEFGNADLAFLHGCEKCRFYICDACIMTPTTINHRWDSHPLHLIYEAGMVTTDHEYDFNCEYCSNDIDTNWWFYHCSVCDLSFHPDCYKRSCYRHYSDFKFGASGIFSDKLHPHNLTFVLNKKFRNCKTCGEEQLGEPVLQCAPCNTIFCRRCTFKLTDTRIAATHIWTRVL